MRAQRSRSGRWSVAASPVPWRAGPRVGRTSPRRWHMAGIPGQIPSECGRPTPRSAGRRPPPASSRRRSRHPAAEGGDRWHAGAAAGEPVAKELGRRAVGGFARRHTRQRNQPNRPATRPDPLFPNHRTRSGDQVDPGYCPARAIWETSTRISPRARLADTCAKRPNPPLHLHPTAANYGFRLTNVVR